MVKGRRCLLCRKPTQGVAMFEPTHPNYVKRLGGAGMHFYPCCPRCHRRMELKPERLEPGLVEKLVGSPGVVFHGGLAERVGLK